jgi:aldehyde dehydrogenase (NAD+)
VPLWMLGPTLLEGNTVVFKPSEDTPAVGQKLVELFIEAGFPPGVLNLVHGDGVVGEALVKNPDVNIVLFTGSWEVGARIQKLSADYYDRIVACEMGSKSAVIVFDDCKLDLAVMAGILSAFKTSGQRCVSAGRLLIQQSIFDKYAQKLVETAKRLIIGDPLDPASFTGPVIHEGSVEKVLFYNELARKENATVLLEGGRMTQGPLGHGCYLSPFIYRQEHKPGIRTVREEVFGPHLALVPFQDIDDAIRIYNDTEYGLSLAVITEDFRKMRTIREECEFGMGYVNLPCIGAEVHLPFGGVKKSGNGHPSAAGLADVVTHKISWTVNHAEEIKMAQGLKAEVR